MSTDSDAISIHELLQDRSIYQMPLFQRKYQWSVGDQLEKFWSDISTVVDDQVDRSFLGAIVLQTENEGTSKRSRVFTVIDGQQRITTFYLFMCAIVNYSRSKGFENVASDLETQYLISALSGEKGRAKIVPTLRDNANFNEVLNGIEGNKIKHLPGTGRNDGPMILAYLYFGEKIEEYMGDVESGDESAKLSELYDAVLEKMEVVQIVLDKSHNANEVFDRLNNAGQPLAIIDLVRNEMFQTVSDDYEDALRLYNELWEPFERSFDASLSDFTEKDRRKVIDGFFFPYALTRHPSAKKNNLLQDLRSIWNKLSQGPGIQAEAVIHDLELMREPYLAIDQGIRPDGIGDQLWEAILGLRKVPIPGVTNPYFMSLLAAVSKSEVDEQDALEVCRIIEAFFVRRGFVGLEPTGLHSVFKKLWSEVGADFSRLTGELETRTISFPTDEEVRASVESKALYKRKIEKFVLATYEAGLQDKSLSRLKFLPDITTDHVMPQKWQGDWKKVLSKSEHEQIVDLWGNLVPLSAPENSAKGASNYKEAREKLSDETSFKTARRLLQTYDDWTKETILERSRLLGEWAVERWPKPS